MDEINNNRYIRKQPIFIRSGSMLIEEKELSFLVVEDNAGDFLLLQEYLKEVFVQATIHHAASFTLAKEKLKSSTLPDLIILDLTLPDKSGPELVKEIGSFSKVIPIIVLTGYGDEDFGLKTLSWGASDFLMKDDLNSSQLYKSITYSIERKRNLNNLRKSEEKYKSIFTFHPLPMWVVDAASCRFLDVNAAAIKHYGYCREEFLTMFIWDIKPPAEQGEFEERIKKLYHKEDDFEQVCTHHNKNGETILMEVQSHEIILNEKKARLELGIDITEKYKAERALKLSEQRFRALVQNGNDLIVILDMEGRFLYVSSSTYHVLGSPAESYIGKNIYEYLHPDDEQQLKQHFHLLKAQQKVYMPPFRLINAKGNWRWLESVLTNLVEDPAVGGIVANARDVTERVEYENNLRESVARYNIVAKATSDTIWDWNLETGQVLWNRGITEVFGYSEAEIESNAAWWEKRLHAEDAEAILSKLNDHIKNKVINWEEEYRFCSTEGTYKYVLDKGFLVVDKQGKPVRMLGAMQDITQRKHEEEHLRLLESVITNSTDSVMITCPTPNGETGILYVNEAFEKMTGYSKEEVLGKSPRFLHGTNSNNAELDYLKKTVFLGQPCAIEILSKRKNGEAYWVQINVAPVKNAKNIITHFIAIERDITEQKNYIHAMEHQNLKLREIAWMQSHIVRAPLARIMGLIEYLQNQSHDRHFDTETLGYIYTSANELDHLLRAIVEKTEQVEINSGNGD